MVNTEFKNFIKLVELDSESHELSLELSKLTDQIQTLNSQILLINSETENSNKILSSLKKELDSLELDLKSLDEQEKVKKKKIEDTGSPKEYFSLEQELSTISSQKELLESNILKLLEKLETAQVSHKSLILSSDKKRVELEEDIKNFERRISYLKNQIDKLANIRAELEDSVLQEYLERYNIMKNKVPNPVVKVLDSSCPACFFALTAQDINLMRQQKLADCKSCFRAMYFPLDALDKKVNYE